MLQGRGPQATVMTSSSQTSGSTSPLHRRQDPRSAPLGNTASEKDGSQGPWGSPRGLFDDAEVLEDCLHDLRFIQKRVLGSRLLTGPAERSTSPSRDTPW